MYLRYFCDNLPKNDGTPCSPSSLVCIRAAIYRYLQLHSQRKHNIIESRCHFLYILENYFIVFCTVVQDNNSNLVISCWNKKLEFTNSGGQNGNYVPIEEVDLNKIWQHFDRTSAQKIQDEVIFAALLAFREREQEHLKSLMHRDFLIKSVDSEGREYMRLKSLDSKSTSYDLKEVNFKTLIVKVTLHIKIVLLGIK